MMYIPRGLLLLGSLQLREAGMLEVVMWEDATPSIVVQTPGSWSDEIRLVCAILFGPWVTFQLVVYFEIEPHFQIAMRTSCSAVGADIHVSREAERCSRW